MFEDKIKVNTDDFGKTADLAVSPYISDSDQRTLIGIYLSELFSKDNDTIHYNVVNAENSLLLAELELLTNIQLVDDNNIPLFTLNDVFKNIRFINDKLKSIANYADFVYRLNYTIEMVKEERRLEHSMSSMVENAYTKLISILDAFQDLNPEAVKAMIDEINKSDILKESLELFKNQKGAKSPKKKTAKSEE